MTRTTEQRRAAFELGRRLSMRRRKAAGLPACALTGTTGRYSIPSRATSLAGVEAKRQQKVTVTLPKLNLPEYDDDA